MIEDSSNFILSNSQAIQKTLFPNVSAKRIETIYASVEIPIDDLQEPIDPLFSEAVLRMILIGTMIPVKGHLDAILAVRELVMKQGKKDVELLLIGSIGLKSYYDEIMEVIRQNNLQKHIHILDFQKNIFAAIQQTDILLICSRLEAFGRITLEAMLLGKPVIGANRGGTPELVQDNLTGLLYEPGDYDALAEKISYLYDHPQKRQEFGQNAIQYARTKFTVEATYGRTVQIAFALKGQKNKSSSATSNFAVHLFKNAIDIQQTQMSQQENDFQSALMNKQKEKELLLGQLHNKEHELTEIYRSKAWRYVQRYRRFKEQLRKIIFKK